MRRVLAFVAFVLAAGVAAGVAPASVSCQKVALSWGVKCLAVGEYCKVSADAEYRRHGFACPGGRLLLAKAAALPKKPSAGCEPGYSPCLPRVADLNCADIPASKKPVRVTGSDPYRLDGNHDGWGCTS